MVPSLWIISGGGNYTGQAQSYLQWFYYPHDTKNCLQTKCIMYTYRLSTCFLMSTDTAVMIKIEIY